MSARILVLFCLLITVLLITGSAEAQQARKVPRIGYLTATSLSSNVARIDAFRQGLRELGYVEGKNILIEWRSGEGKLERQGELAAELVRLKVDVIITSGPTITRAAKEATVTIPIVMAFDSDPIGNGFIASLARPGGHLAGLSARAPEWSGARLGRRRELVPERSRVAVLGNASAAASPTPLQGLELAAGGC